MPKKMAIHCFVSGKVQGVCFRAGTKAQADVLGLTGFARNLSDGRVEVVACGFDEALDQLHYWLKKGPERADVKAVTYEELPWREYQGFLVL